MHELSATPRRSFLKALAVGGVASAGLGVSDASAAQVVADRASSVFAADYGVGPDNVDNTAALRAADAAAAERGAALILPPGALRVLGTAFVARSGLHIIGEGMGQTTIMMVGDGGGRPFYFVGPSGATGGTPDVDIAFSEFAVDASGVTQTASKPFFAQYLRRVLVERVRVVGAPYTGFGMDHMVDATFRSCIAENCGRLAAIGDAGASGFGIGTGEYPTENVALINCVGRGNKNYGAFFEQQNVANGGKPYLSTGATIVGCYFANNGYGVGDSGVRGIVVAANVIENNVRDGMAVDQGTGGGIGSPGVEGLIEGNVIRANGRYGVFLDYRWKAAKSQESRYAVRGNTITGNRVTGVQCSTDTYSIKDVMIQDNQIVGNGASGIQAVVISSGAWVDLTVQDNRISNNGQTNSSGYTQGLRVDGRTTRLRVVGNHFYDNGASPKQSHGIRIGSSVHRDIVIADNDLRGNVAGSLLLGSGASLPGMPSVRSNRGHNPLGVMEAPNTPASDVAYANATGYDCTVFISVASGEVTAVSMVGSQGAVVTGLRVAGPGAPPAAVRVPAGGAISIGYTGVISWTWAAE